MRLILYLRRRPSPLVGDRADDCSAAFVHDDAFHTDDLLAFSSMTIKGFKERRQRAGRFVGEREKPRAALERLVLKPRSP